MSSFRRAICLLLLFTTLTVSHGGAPQPQLTINSNGGFVAHVPDDVASTAIVLNSEEPQFNAEAIPWVEQVGAHPQVFYYHNFLSTPELKHVISLAAPQMKRSLVSGEHGKGVIDNIRTSYGMFIRRFHDPIIEKIERRVALWTQIPMSHQEDIQVLRYSAGQTYRAHYDSSYDKSGSGPKQRLATMLIYLSDVEEGGETAFPESSVWMDPAMGEKAGWSDCAKGHVAAKPKAGDAVLFYSYYMNGTMDPASMHTGCPVIKGIKWAAPIWIHIDEFRPEELRQPMVKQGLGPDPGACADYHVKCPEWATGGECTKNRDFMMESCRKSCNECEQCGKNEYDCINRNRKRGGYLEIDAEEMKMLGIDLFQGTEPSPEL